MFLRMKCLPAQKFLSYSPHFECNNIKEEGLWELIYVMSLEDSYIELVPLQETPDNCAALFLIHTIQKKSVNLQRIRESLSGPKYFDSVLGSTATGMVKNNCLLFRNCTV